MLTRTSGVARLIFVVLMLGCCACAEEGLAGAKPGSHGRDRQDETRSSAATSDASTPVVRSSAATQETPLCSYTVVNTYPHDPTAFTQGLLWADGALYEGTGQFNRSTVRRVTLETGEIQQVKSIDSQYFGEGLALVGNRLYQLTWLNGVALVHDKASFALIDSYSYSTQGWGLAFDGTHLIMSDGTSTLRFRDPVTFNVVRELGVFDHLGPVDNLNELEMVKGELYANVWMTFDIVKIDPLTGRVTARIDLTGIYSPSYNEDVLNGIAYDEANDRLFVTGKLWPSLFEIDLVNCPDYFVFRDDFESGNTTSWSANDP